jgi:pentatricopeptide repeat protein
MLVEGIEQKYTGFGNLFELAFPKMKNRSYYCLLYSLVRIGDIEGAEDFLKKWGSVKNI